MEFKNTKYDLVPFTRGRVLSIATEKLFPHFISVGADDVSLFADATMDAVYCDVLDNVKDHDKALKQFWRVLKPGGHLVLQDKPDQPFNHLAVEMLGTWDQAYGSSGLRAFKKGGAGHRYSCKSQQDKKRALVIRYGGIGDLIQTSSIFPGLKDKGYHVTVNCYQLGHDLLKHDPNVDAFLIQDRDQVPNEDLGEYWSYLDKKYDKVVNLSESVESALLALPDRTPRFWPKNVRHLYMNHNYLEFTHKIAEVDSAFAPKFYPTTEEREWAFRERTKMGGGPIVLWTLSGSSVHKSWPYMDHIIARLLTSFPDIRIVLAGDDFCLMLEAPWRNEPRVLCQSGKWSVRETLTFACKQADLVIGPETGVLNAVGHEQVAKVCLLSHSTRENLTKHWINTVAIEPPPSVSCWPCHTLHKTFDTCTRGERTGAALCQEMIPADVVWVSVLGILKRTNVMDRVKVVGG